MREVNLEKILALEMGVPHWSAKRFLEDGTLLDWFPGELIAVSQGVQQFTPMFSTTLISFMKPNKIEMETGLEIGTNLIEKVRKSGHVPNDLSDKLE